jgi:hypothetical protein
MLRDLQVREQKFRGQIIKCVDYYPSMTVYLLKASKLEIDEDDVAMIFEDLHRGRSVIPPHAVPSRPVLVRWDPKIPLTAENCIVMEHNDAEKHAMECLGIGLSSNADKGTSGIVRRPADFWGKGVAMVVERRMKEVAEYREWIM